MNRHCKEKALSSMGLDIRRPYILFGMSAPIFAPHEIDIVEWLASRIQEQQYGNGLQLVVRPHPQNVRGNMADDTWMPRILKLRGNGVGVNLPLLSEGGLNWEMEESDLGVLVNLLAGCEICCNSGSTLSIDALAHGKPVIVTLFDGQELLPWWKSARRIRDFPHYQKLLAFDGLTVADSFASLDSSIKQYLVEPSLRLEQRRKSLIEECGEIDGMASQNVALALRKIVSD